MAKVSEGFEVGRAEAIHGKERKVQMGNGFLEGPIFTAFFLAHTKRITKPSEVHKWIHSVYQNNPFPQTQNSKEPDKSTVTYWMRKLSDIQVATFEKSEESKRTARLIYPHADDYIASSLAFIADVVLKYPTVSLRKLFGSSSTIVQSITALMTTEDGSLRPEGYQVRTAEIVKRTGLNSKGNAVRDQLNSLKDYVHLEGVVWQIQPAGKEILKDIALSAQVTAASVTPEMLNRWARVLFAPGDNYMPDSAIDLVDHLVTTNGVLVKRLLVQSQEESAYIQKQDPVAQKANILAKLYENGVQDSQAFTQVIGEKSDDRVKQLLGQLEGLGLVFTVGRFSRTGHNKWDIKPGITGYITQYANQISQLLKVNPSLTEKQLYTMLKISGDKQVFVVEAALFVMQHQNAAEVMKQNDERIIQSGRQELKTQDPFSNGHEEIKERAKNRIRILLEEGVPIPIRRVREHFEGSPEMKDVVTPERFDFLLGEMQKDEIQAIEGENGQMLVLAKKNETEQKAVISDGLKNEKSQDVRADYIWDQIAERILQKKPGIVAIVYQVNTNADQNVPQHLYVILGDTNESIIDAIDTLDIRPADAFTTSYVYESLELKDGEASRAKHHTFPSVLDRNTQISLIVFNTAHASFRASNADSIPGASVQDVRDGASFSLHIDHEFGDQLDVSQDVEKLMRYLLIEEKSKSTLEDIVRQVASRQG